MKVQCVQLLQLHCISYNNYEEDVPLPVQAKIQQKARACTPGSYLALRTTCTCTCSVGGSSVSWQFFLPTQLYGSWTGITQTHPCIRGAY